ncbi:MAG TPA: alpha/beta hydrolase [Burkholderiales bacterium]|nr:alpha/beta hydrolase [Burkholderiales bacterium]
MSELLPAVEIETAPNPRTSIIWMHGLGADGNDFVPIVNELDLPDTPIRFVFPHAPVMPVTINYGHRMRAWYDVLSSDFAERTDNEGVRASQKLVEALIAREKERGSAADRIVIAGFSQGGAMALHTGLRHAERLAGIMALSTYLPIPDALTQEGSAANRDVPIFMAHGDQDQVIPIEYAAQSRDLLTTQGYQVEWHAYHMPHSVCMEEIAHIGAWLQRVLG